MTRLPNDLVVNTNRQKEWPISYDSLSFLVYVLLSLFSCPWIKRSIIFDMSRTYIRLVTPKTATNIVLITHKVN